MKFLLACCAGLVLWAPYAVAGSETDEAKNYHETVSERTKRMLAEFEERRAEINRDRAEEGQHVFETKDGRQILTNVGHRYNDRSRFKDVTKAELGLAPITVSGRYRNRTVAQYTSSDISSLVKMYSRRYRLDEELVLSVIKVESNFNPNAVSTAGARGLMQLMPGTAKDMGVTKIHDPAQNIAGGTQYLSKCLELFDGDYELALAAYNAGPQAVKNHGGVPPYSETKNYIRLVMGHYDDLKDGKFSTRIHMASKASRALVRSKRSHDADSFAVHFKSGLIQPADRVEEVNDDYLLEYQGRAWYVKKRLVKEIVEPT